MTDLTIIPAGAALEAVRSVEHPVAVYLARLAPGSRATMRDVLDVAAGLFTSG